MQPLRGSAATRHYRWCVAARSEYVIDDSGWDRKARQAAVRQTLDLVVAVMARAETDIPWHNREQWPPDVADAARLLRDRYVTRKKQDDEYLQTGVQAVDDESRRAFATFAPYAYDCTLWSDEGDLASVNDEGDSLVIFLTDTEVEHLRGALGSDRVFSLQQWRHLHPSATTRLLRRFRKR